MGSVDVDSSFLQLLREKVRECYIREGVNHFQYCRKVRAPLQSVTGCSLKAVSGLQACSARKEQLSCSDASLPLEPDSCAPSGSAVDMH